MKRFVAFWLPLAMIAFWLLFSGAAMAWWSPGYFQRAGAIGIAGAIALFAGQKRNLALKNSQLSRIETDEKLHKFCLHMAKERLNLYDDIAEIAARSGSSEIVDRIARGRASVDEMTIGSQREADAIATAKQETANVERDIVWTEVVILVLATIQTGYGDILFKAVLCGEGVC